MTTTPATAHVLYIHLHPLAGGTLDAELYTDVLEILGGITPLIQALPPDAALADVSGSQRYFHADPAEIATLIRVRALAFHRVECTIGAASNPLLAKMIAHSGPPGAVRTLTDPQVTAFLRPCPTSALPGIGPATSRTLAQYGLTTIGQIATTPLATLQRILGATHARQLHERAHGIDHTPVVPGLPPRTISADHTFDHDQLEPAAHRRTLLALTQSVSAELRTRHQVAGALTLTVRYADGSSTTRTRKLAEPTAHTPVIGTAVYGIYASLGLQRARVRKLTLRAESPTPAAGATRQLTFEAADDKRRRIEAVADRARRRYGHAALGPAALYGTRTRP